MRAVWLGFVGLFVEDAGFAVAILAWIAGCWLVLPRLVLPGFLPPVVLFAGLGLILVESAMRRARRSS